MRVDIRKGELFELAERIVSQIAHDIVGDLVGAKGHKPLAKRGDRDSCEQQRDPWDKRLEVNIALGDDDIYRLTYDDRCVKRCRNALRTYRHRLCVACKHFKRLL